MKAKVISFAVKNSMDVYSEIPERILESIKLVSEEVKKTGKPLGTLEHPVRESSPRLSKEDIKLPPGMNIALIQPERVNPDAIERNLVNAKKLIEYGEICT